MYKYIFFDLDGTLTDSAEGIINACIYALGKEGMDVPERGFFRKFLGPPLDESYMKYFGVSPEKAWEMVGLYRVYYADKGVYENRVYDGVREMFEALAREGKKLVITTSKPYETTMEVLNHFGLTRYFAYIGAATMDGTISKKKDVIAHTIHELGIMDRSEAVMIGDRDQDVIGALENGIDFIGALYGYGSREELAEHNATHFVSSVNEIVSKIKEMEETKRG